MFYEPKNHDHGLSRNPFKSIIIPRPIGWISSIDGQSVGNLAPYSFFNAVSEEPPIVMFSCGSSLEEDGKKDTLRNVEVTREFVCNVATWEFRDQMNESSARLGPKIDELTEVGLTAMPSILVKPPRVAEAPIHLECKYIKSIELPYLSEDNRSVIVLGEVVGIHIIDELIMENGLINVDRLNPIGRLGYKDYVRVDQGNMFFMHRPD